MMGRSTFPKWDSKPKRIIYHLFFILLSLTQTINGGLRISKKEVKPQSEIDLIQVMAKKMTPKEIDSYVHNRFAKDLQFFIRVQREQKEFHERIKSDQKVHQLLTEVKCFYNDLVEDGYFNKDLDLFDFDSTQNMQVAQSREEYASNFNILNLVKDDYFGTFRKLNRSYVNNYESMIEQYLVSIAERILGKKIEGKGSVLNVVKTYRKAKYNGLFKSLIPQIRNAIQHEHALIDPKQPKITFCDNHKKPLSLTLEEYLEISRRNLCLTVSFDLAYYELGNNLLEVLSEMVETVDDYLKKNQLMLAESNREKGMSIADLALLIKSGKL